MKQFTELFRLILELLRELGDENAYQEAFGCS